MTRICQSVRKVFRISEGRGLAWCILDNNDKLIRRIDSMQTVENAISTKIQESVILSHCNGAVAQRRRLFSMSRLPCKLRKSSNSCGD